MKQTDRVPNESKRGRPRDPNVDARVLRAVVEELANAGVSEFSINAVAARAGVAKRSVYSRWPQRDDLILAGLATLSVDLSVPQTGSLEMDLRALYDQMAVVFDESRWSIMVRCMLELNEHPDLHAAAKRAYYDPCMAVIRRCLADAQRRGELRGSVDIPLAAEMFANTVLGLGSAMGQRRGTDTDTRDGLIGLLIDGLAPPEARAPRARRASSRPAASQTGSSRTADPGT